MGAFNVVTDALTTGWSNREIGQSWQSKANGASPQRRANEK